MTGTLRSGKTSTFMRVTARPAPRARAAMPTMTLIGCRRAKTMGFIGESLGGRIQRLARNVAASFQLAVQQRQVGNLPPHWVKASQWGFGPLRIPAPTGQRAVPPA